MLPTRDPFRPRDTNRLKVKGWKKISHSNGDQKKGEIAILILDKIDFETKALKRDKEGHCIMIKGSIQEEDITIINRYASPRLCCTQKSLLKTNCLKVTNFSSVF